MGCFNPAKSDIDLLYLVSSPPTPARKLAFLNALLPLNEAGPAKGVELSVVEEKWCRPFTHPLPYLFHFSPAHLGRIREDPAGYVETMTGTDRDLAAHCAVLERYSRVLYGPPISEVFGPVSPGDYRDSILWDLEDAPTLMARDPLYATLNLCRALAFFRAGLCLSKRDGALWGLEHLPEEFHPLLRHALACYSSTEELPPSDLALSFATYALGELPPA